MEQATVSYKLTVRGRHGHERRVVMTPFILLSTYYCWLLYNYQLLRIYVLYVISMHSYNSM